MDEDRSDPVVLDVGQAAARAARSELLTRAGYRVVGAESEEEARRLAATQPIDVIILDRPLCDEDCRAAVARLKADPALSTIPVLRMVERMTRCALLSPRLEAGADMCLLTSSPPETLLATVGALLRAGRAFRQAQQYVIEHRQMEEEHAALLAEAQHWRTLLDAVLHQMPSGVVVVNASGDVVLSNEEAKRISPRIQPGPVAETLDGGVEVLHPDGRRYTVDELPAVRALRAGEVVVREELILSRGEAGEAVVRASATPIRDSTGRITAAVVVFGDVTEEQRAQEEREQQARLLDALVENTDYWLAYLDRELRFVMANSAFAEKSRLSREELIGKHFLEVFPEQTDIYAFYQQARDTGQTVSRAEYATEIANRPDWGPRFISFSMAPVKDAEGNVEGVVLSALDVTAQVEARRRTEMAERAWARQARLLEAIQESVPIGLGYLDRDLRFVQVNSTLAELIGLSREEAIGRECREMCPDSGHLAVSLAHVRDTGEPFEAREVRGTIGQWPEDGGRVLDVAGVPVVHDGVVEGVVVAVMDVTDRAQQREQLLAAERARTELAEHLGDEIAHRVKNNLAMVSGLLQMQAITSGHPEIAAALREAVVRVRMFANIHEQMYASRAEEVRLLQVLRQVADSTRAVFAARKEVAVTVSGEETTVPARAATNLSVVANELLTNGLKHGGPAQDGRLHVALSLDRHDGVLHLAVWNSGNPIAADFDPQARPGMGMQLLWDVVVNGYGGTLHLEPRDGGTLAEAVIETAALDQ